MSDAYLIRNCAPTLAGIKTASLFTCPYGDKQSLITAIRQINKRLKPKGLRILPLRFSGKKALIYLYCPAKLSEDLQDASAAQLLQRCGYHSNCCGHCVACLARKLQMQADFPHEIGLFLGYPPEDVRGFIDHGPQGCKCSGCWKVYGDVKSARQKFDQYKKCSRIYWEQWSKGKDIERLTVAG